MTLVRTRVTEEREMRKWEIGKGENEEMKRLDLRALLYVPSYSSRALALSIKIQRIVTDNDCENKQPNAMQ